MLNNQTWLSNQEFATHCLTLFHAATGEMKRKKLAIILAGNRRATRTYAGSHAHVSQAALADFDVMPEVCAVVGACDKPGCPCGGSFYVRTTAPLADGTRFIADSKHFPEADLDKVLEALPSVLETFREVFQPGRPAEENGGAHA